MSVSQAYGYIRVSTTMQKEDGISLDTQTKRIKDYCEYKRYEFKKVYSDAGKSGGTMERPALKEVLDIIKKGDYLIVAELSRLSRNTKDALSILEVIKKKGGYLVSLNPDIDFSSAIGEMMYTILSAFHQLERKQIAERVSLNMLNLSKQQLLRSKPPFGYKFVSKDEDFIIDEEQQKVKSIIIDLFNSHNTYNKIANILNKKEINKCLSEDGSQLFYAQTIKNILADEDLITSNRKSLKSKFMSSRKNIEK